MFAELAVDPSLSDACAEELAALTGTSAPLLRAARPTAAPGAADTVVWLTRNYCFAADSGIGRLASRINAGDVGGALDLLRLPGRGLVWIDDGRDVLGEVARQSIEAGYAGFLDAVGRGPHDPRAVPQAYARFRVLCAVRAGPRGVDAVNALLEQRLRAAQRTPTAHRGPSLSVSATWRSLKNHRYGGDREVYPVVWTA